MAIKNRKFVVLILISTTVVSFSFYFYQVLFTANIQVDREDEDLYIPNQASYTTVLDSLAKKKSIQDILSFRFLAKVLGYPSRVHPGRYVLRKNSSNLSVILKLRSGKQDPVKVTFNTIRTKKNLAGKICKYLEVDSLNFFSVLTSPAIVQKYGFDTTTILCMFIPNTYSLYWNMTSEKLLKRFYHEYQSFWTSERRDKANRMGLTPIQVSVLASIVQAETIYDKEKPAIAGVYMNRLNKNMRLQADPTVVYAVGDFTIQRVLKGHKEVDSPYNTYKYSGLPPGPINLPSITSIDAVLNYEHHDYLYFCAKENFSGYHRFAVSFEDHLKNARLYQKALDQSVIH